MTVDQILIALRRGAANDYPLSVSPHEALALVAEVERLREGEDRRLQLLDDVGGSIKPSTHTGARLEWGPKTVEDLRELVANLKEAIKDAPCLVARPGETTYECRHDSLCRVCQWRNTVIADLG